MTSKTEEKIRGRAKIPVSVMTRDYIVALTLVGALAITAAVVLGLILNAQQRAGAVVNLSGRQRMLSQRIPLFALRLASEEDEAAALRLRQRLNDDIRLMAQSHQRQLSGGGGAPPPSPRVRALFLEPPVRLDSQIKKFLTRARRIADAPPGQLSENDPDIQYLLRVSVSTLPTALNQVVVQYERENNTTVERLEAVVRTTTGIILLVLVAEAFIIFKPMVERIRRQTGELERAFAEEHHIADTLQKGLAPRAIPPIDGLEIKVSYQSATRAAEVGGDFYEFFELTGGRWGIVMGDVEGHGVDAAAETARVKYLLRDKAGLADLPGEALKRLNESMTAQGSERFTALTYAVYDPRTALLVLANAANPYPYFSRTNGYIETTGVPMGIVSGEQYASVDLTLESGDLLLFFSDGLIEARRGRQLFERERIRKFITAHRESSLADLVNGLVDEARDFAGGRLTDDILVIAMRKA